MTAKCMNSKLLMPNIGKDLFSAPAFLQDGDVVELCGSQGCGKSSLLQHLMIECLLPKEHSGCHSGVIYFDLDCHFDLLRIISIIERRTGAGEEEIKKWLKNLHVIHCESSEQLVITLHSIEPLIVNGQVPVSMIILDSISSFYWIDVCAAGKNSYMREACLQKVVQILQIFKEQYGVCVLASTQQLVNPDQKLGHKTEGDLLPYKPFLCRQWLNFVKHRFVLTAKDATTDERNIINAYCIAPSRYKKRFVIDKKGVHFVC